MSSIISSLYQVRIALLWVEYNINEGSEHMNAAEKTVMFKFFIREKHRI